MSLRTYGPLLEDEEEEDELLLEDEPEDDELPLPDDDDEDELLDPPPAPLPPAAVPVPPQPASIAAPVISAMPPESLIKNSRRSIESEFSLPI
jgi:hypothetical protein